jgi:hypothetical protein
MSWMDFFSPFLTEKLQKVRIISSTMFCQNPKTSGMVKKKVFLVVVNPLQV